MFTLPTNFADGAARRWRRLPGLVLAEIDYAPDSAITERHPHARFVLVVRGTLRSTDLADAARLWFCPAGSALSLTVSPGGARCLILDMDEGWLARLRGNGPVLSHARSFRSGLVIHLAQRLHDEFGQRDEVSRLAIDSLAVGLIAEASRRALRETPEGRRPPAWLERARAFVDQHFSERLPLTAVAAVVGVHPVHLARTFRRAYDTTLCSYIRTVRLDFARRQLATTAVPVADIAAAAGFYDQSHFCRLFKQATGLSPAVYRDSVARR